MPLWVHVAVSSTRLVILNFNVFKNHLVLIKQIKIQGSIFKNSDCVDPIPGISLFNLGPGNSNASAEGPEPRKLFSAGRSSRDELVVARFVLVPTTEQKAQPSVTIQHRTQGSISLVGHLSACCLQLVIFSAPSHSTFGGQRFHFAFLLCA